MHVIQDILYETSSPMTNDLCSWNNLQKILDFSGNSDCIIKIMASMNSLYCLDTEIVNIA